MIDHKQYAEYVRYVAQAHQEHVLPTAKAMRVFPSGEKNPYFTHTLWCSMMMLLDTQLPENLRDAGAVALLFHDVLEDTSSPLPDSLSPEAVQFVHEIPNSIHIAPPPGMSRISLRIWLVCVDSHSLRGRSLNCY